MLPLIDKHREDIAELCRRFQVRRLDVFGSAARGDDFDPARSDIDFIVEYQSDNGAPSLQEFLSLRQGLRNLLGREIDLTAAGAIRNPYIRADIDGSRKQVYAS
ncbi:nucleotidyltransferase family protein [Niveispirillum sp. KHB5.9]|uniref:nucleotidyltransferase family protein n=1 Tax=Niveispirillum sp. KHB5.9 TaxID=3400269 RepID=UPI003A85F422